ncbi:serine hydrolase [Motiliproteus sp. MSK22-1]|uniref:serine hydrolase n=1 Tax=Motiliproteus sp. MSK22-1 TaxID=1897630 RepID=UPI00097616AE|nr:serine hydrolase [Motiliproteus sp. MSK22-1]OMH39258.1 peptidase S11 [Motiliproteus sp. MSK22-1]
MTNPWLELNPELLKLRSAAVLVVDSSGAQVFKKQIDNPMPIASITKLMTAMVILDSDLPLDQKITITKQDRDLVRLTGSRLKYGATLQRKEMLKLALMASENRAASALARTFPGGTEAFVIAMNKKAKQLGMEQSHFSDPAGLQVENVASARDLVKLVTAASNYPLIESASGTRKLTVHPYAKRGPLIFGNTNRLLKNKAWDISVSKTGYINEAGRCLVMKAEVDGNELVFVLLNSFGKLTPYGDSNRIRKWIRQGT